MVAEGSASVIKTKQGAWWFVEGVPGGAGHLLPPLALLWNARPIARIGLD